jgi:ABC transporter substrate binding protein (PQQ-dependent alcohol dehydrogenase system)
MLARLVLSIMFAAVPLPLALAHAEVAVRIAYLEQRVPQPPTLSNLDPVPIDLGLAGARLGLADNATTGRFLGQAYSLEEIAVESGGDWTAGAAKALAASDLIVVNAPATEIVTLADLPTAAGALIFNASAEEAALRGRDCRANVLHTVPSYAMRADALAQFLQAKRWTDWALIAGVHPGDQAFAEALRAASDKFGLLLRGERVWEFDADMRRSAAQEIPVFTQEMGDYDVLVVADELGDFGRYIPYNTWEPRLVAGSEGLAPTAWAPVLEQWGAAQLQERFRDAARRPMRPVDYAAWAAVRAIGEAVIRTGAIDAASLRAFLLSDAFELAGFKGRPLSFRSWDGQLRQPIALAGSSAVVAMAPMEGFLHQRNELDTLGTDAPETTCTAFDRGPA